MEGQAVDQQAWGERDKMASKAGPCPQCGIDVGQQGPGTGKERAQDVCHQYFTLLIPSVT